MNISGIAKPIGDYITRNSPQILTGFAAAGVLSTAVLAAKATPEAVRRVMDAQSEMLTVTTIDKIRLMAPCYIPAAIMGGVTIACIVGVNSVNTKRNAALMSAYTLTEQTLTEYREKVIQEHGPDTDGTILDHIATDRVHETLDKQIVVMGGGKVLSYDIASDRYFESDAESIKKAVNDLNAQIINEGYASQNDFYRALGLPAVSSGEDVGWTSDKLLDIRLTSILNKADKPCLAISYTVEPKTNYYKVF